MEKKKRNDSRRKSTDETVGRKRNSKVQTMLYVTVCFCFRTEQPPTPSPTPPPPTGPASAELELELSRGGAFSATLLPLPLRFTTVGCTFALVTTFSVVGCSRWWWWWVTFPEKCFSFHLEKLRFVLYSSLFRLVFS